MTTDDSQIEGKYNFYAQVQYTADDFRRHQKGEVVVYADLNLVPGATEGNIINTITKVVSQLGGTVKSVIYRSNGNPDPSRLEFPRHHVELTTTSYLGDSDLRYQLLEEWRQAKDHTGKP